MQGFARPAVTKIHMSEYIAHAPTARQQAFLSWAVNDYLEVLFGGQVGGGKSDALLMAALQYADVPGYSGLLLRRTYSDLALPGALMDRAAEWLQPTAAHWNAGTKTWSFPSSATLTFGYLENEKHKYRYQGSEFQYVGWDELTQFPLSPYLYLFSRLRKTKDIPVPLRVRAGSNPGGEGHAWVFERFIAGQVDNARSGKRLFIPSGLRDNPYIDAEQYEESLSELDEVTQAQLLRGEWITDPSRKAFQPEWWRGKNRFRFDAKVLRADVVARWCSWDTALKDGDGNDYSACVVAELTSDYRLLIVDVWRDRLQFPDLPDAIATMASRWNYDGKLSGVLIEDKASGTSAYQTLLRTAPDWLAAILQTFRPTTDKVQRARQAAVWCKRNSVLLPHPDARLEWMHDFEHELYAFPDVTFDDQTDALDQLILYLENYISAGWRAREGEGQDHDHSESI
jgi:predicted phage terminase large subunit-like protein